MGGGASPPFSAGFGAKGIGGGAASAFGASFGFLLLGWKVGTPVVDLELP